MGILLVKSLFAVLISFLVTFYLVPPLCIFARRVSFLDVPDGKIKNHATSVPYLGGVALYLGFLVSLAIVLPFQNTLVSFLIGITLLLFIGLLDDFFVLKPYQKFFGQCIVALCFLKAGFYLKGQFFLQRDLISIPLSLLWILVVINAFNLVDVMDGLTSTISLCAVLSFIGIAFMNNNSWLMLLLCSLLGSLFAFFFYNRPPASIYLGDAGSLFLGGFFAAVPFLFPWGIHSAYGFFAPVIILAIPLIEIFTLVLIRTYKGIPFYLGSPDHFSLYLLRNGWSKNHILGYVVLISFLEGLVAFELVAGALSLQQLVALGVVFCVFWYGILCLKPTSKQ
jgi:UDP-GlcNAc:undecaprenyl-phosphate GlcNAc-1-phosphate transferase